MSRRETLRLVLPGSVGAVDAIFDAAQAPIAMFVFAHGAGADMRHPWMERTSESLRARDISVLRYQFPYMQAGSHRPDRPAVLIDTVAAAVAWARERNGDAVPLHAGGKSMGGRMTTLAMASKRLGTLHGIVCFGFPLHAAKRTGVERADHLYGLHCPLLFLQGSRDALSPLAELEPVIAALGPHAELFVVEDGDHGFAVRKRSGRTAKQVEDEIADRVLAFVRSTSSRM